MGSSPPPLSSPLKGEEMRRYDLPSRGGNEKIWCSLKGEETRRGNPFLKGEEIKEELNWVNFFTDSGALLEWNMVHFSVEIYKWDKWLTFTKRNSFLKMEDMRRGNPFLKAEERKEENHTLNREKWNKVIIPSMWGEIINGTFFLVREESKDQVIR